MFRYKPHFKNLLMLRKLFTISLFILLFSGFVRAQQETPQKLTHWLTPEELTRLDEIGLTFVETDPPIAPVRNVAEFDQMQGVLIRYPFGIPMALIKEMAEDVMVTTIVQNVSQQNTVLQQYINNWVDTSHCDFLIAPTNSYWTRDYGPWFVSDSSNKIGIVDFPYNRPRPYDDEIPKLIAQQLGIPWFGMNLTHTGGNYMTDGMGISASTELVWEENLSLSHDQVAEKVYDYLGITNYHVVPDPNGTYIDHIDCWGKFLAPDKILIREVPSTHSQYHQLEMTAEYWANQICPYGYNYLVYRVNTPQNQPYTNSLILNNKVLVPLMNSVWDDSALLRYENAMPGYEIIGIYGQGSAPWEATDALHCRTKGIADTGLLYIWHIPVTGLMPCENDYLIEADIIASSDSAMKTDSVLIFYKIDNGAYQSLVMSNPYECHWVGYIPAQPAGSTVYYYLFAADKSDRRATRPFIGAPDAYHFETIYTNLTAIPDTLWFNNSEDCTTGKSTVLYNFTAGAVTVSSIEPEGYQSGFTWYVYPSPACPVILSPADTLGIRVFLILPLMGSDDGYLVDTLSIVTEVDTVDVIIMVNDSIFTSSGSGDQRVTCYLGTNYPNPFRSSTMITFFLADEGSVKLEIITIQGRLVHTLMDARLQPGLNQVNWDGTDQSGNLLPGGVYIYRLTTGNGTFTRRCLLIR